MPQTICRTSYRLGTRFGDGPRELDADGPVAYNEAGR